MVADIKNLTYQGVPVWRHAQIIRWVVQIVSGVLVVSLVVWFFANVANAVQARDIPHGFSFLSREYQTPIGEHFIPYESSDTFLYAIVVAITNTLIVSIAGVILATLLGIFIGVARLSGNWLVSRLALVYIEFFRNVPLLVQLLFWFFIILALPVESDAYNIFAGNAYISNSGVSMAWLSPTNTAASTAWITLVVVAIIAGFIVNRRLNRREMQTGQSSYPFMAGWATVIVIGVASWIVVGMMAGESPFAVSSPEPQGQFMRISGGFTLRAGLLVVLLGLVTYTAAFIAEIVRAGIQSVSRGQTEAARALGLSPMETLRSVTFPQALRVIIPPLISQCLNLTKNSSLGGAVGYSDLTSVALTMTQTAPAVSIFLIIMASYLAMSLTWSLIGNLYNRRAGFIGG